MRQPGQGPLAPRSVLAAAALIALLSGCVAGGPPDAGDDTAFPATDGTPAIERDVEAPEVFSATDRALWDGRPSLGGIWIAAPDVGAPERVVIRDPQTGAATVGALFKRERDNPGPPLQLSSEAAEALGILAGVPTVVEVVALRREAAPLPAADPVAPEPAPRPDPGLTVGAVTTLSGRPTDGNGTNGTQVRLLSRVLGWGDRRLAVDPS